MWIVASRELFAPISCVLLVAHAILFYCDSPLFLVSCCGFSGDSSPAILGIVRFAVRDSVPLSSDYFRKCPITVSSIVPSVKVFTLEHSYNTHILNCFQTYLIRFLITLALTLLNWFGIAFLGVNEFRN